MKASEQKIKEASQSIIALCDAIWDNKDAPMRSSAQVCFEDAQACVDRHQWDYAIARARKGLAYMGAA